MYIDGNSETQLVTKRLVQVSVQEVHDNMVISQYEGGLKYAKDAENDIIIRDSRLYNILLPQLIKISARYKLVRGFNC